MGFRSLQDVRADRIARDVVQNQGQIIESDDVMESAGQVMEQRMQIPMGDDGFRDREKSEVLLAVRSGCALCRRSPMTQPTSISDSLIG